MQQQKQRLNSYIDIADMHNSRLSDAIIEIEKNILISEASLPNLDSSKVAFLDMMTTRFGKLQDLLGAKIFPTLLEIIGEDGGTFIDKLNKLEKFEYIQDANWWMELRVSSS